uniref:tRNA (guanosine(18)-2'-O)-methyltransferase TARBP1 n=2 Tax=Anthurium amnicola TaxID=1678845 RepID=A0A1D1XU92_9ARAE
MCVHQRRYAFNRPPLRCLQAPKRKSGNGEKTERERESKRSNMLSTDGGGRVPAAPHVASLTRSFSLVPPAAVPAVIDCVLASSGFPPSELFSSLLEAFPELTEGLRKDCSKLDLAQSNFLISYTAALFHLIKNPGISPDAFRVFIWRVFVPLLSATGPGCRELLNQLEDLLCDAVAVSQSWELMESTLVPACLRSVGLSLGMTQHKELAVYRWRKIESTEVTELGSLPLTVACHLLSSLLDAVLRVRGPPGRTTSREVASIVGTESSAAFAQNLTWDLSLMAIDMLLQRSEYRSYAIQLLFPVIFRAVAVFPSFGVLVDEMAHSFSRAFFFRNIWERCISMFSVGHLERVDACNLLSLYFSVLNDEGGVNRDYEVYDLRAENKFWEAIRRGLVDKDASVRKHSLYILKKLSCDSFQMGSDYNQSLFFNLEPTVQSIVTVAHHDNILSGSGMTRRERWADKEARSMHVGEIHKLHVNGLDRWKAFFLLYDMLEEYGTHLVEAAWNNQISLLFQSGSCDNMMNNVAGGLYQNQMEALDGMFSWLAILWERGLFHENPQVRCLIMQSFLGMDWGFHRHYVKHVPKSFVLGPFILGLNDVIHHKDFGLGGLYTSRTIQGATKFFGLYSGEFSRSERIAFICSLASLAREESFGRPGLMAFASCLSSAACGIEAYHASVAQHYENLSHQMEQVVNQEGHMHNTNLELLDALGIIVERSKQHFNPKYRLEVCERVLDATSSVICACCMPLEMLFHFLSTLPREFTDIGGTLRRKVQQWLHCGCNGCLPNPSDSEMAVLRNLLGFPTSFMKHKVSVNAFNSFDDEDLDAWDFEVQRWVRVFFLIITQEQHLEPIYQVIQDFGGCISSYESSLDWFPPKFLNFVVCLVEELQILLKKYICYSGSSSEFAVDLASILGQLPLTVSMVVFKKFKNAFLFILESLMSFANSICSIFWSVPMEKDTKLPSSVKGKLGGPSQRRLPLLTTAALLQAILSIKAVASITSWTMQFERDLWLNSSFTFLWNFSWKVILCSTSASEAGAEIHLAAYEALVSVLKALSTAFSPLALEFVIAFNRSTFPDGQEKPLLDPFILNFLQNINNLLAEGTLTRSRRSILMNWKWLCLDYLLSIPYNVLESGAQPSTTYTFFSDSALRITFSDIVESLENAGETSVLALLRSVRSIIGLFCPGRICSAVSLCNGIDIKMMMQLVKSSWILHLSCNKRRIAPIAALLSSVLHPLVFSDLSMHEMNDNHGPLKWFIEKILDEGTKSPRTIRLVALHLTGLWLSHPVTVKYYIKELILLSLHGSVAFDEDFQAELSENQEAMLEVAMLSRSPDAELTEVFINTEMYARVAVAALFDKLANLADFMRDQKNNDDSQSALLAGKMFLLELLSSAVTDKDLSKELYKKFSGIHRRKVRAWQMICILSRFVDHDIVKQVSSMMHVCLYRNNLPGVRQYLEIFAIQIYLKFPSLVEEQLVPIFHDYNVRPQALSSYVFIAANVILHANEVSVQLKHLNILLPPIIPLLTSHHHSLRGFTQLLVYHVLRKLMSVMGPDNLGDEPLEKKCFRELKSYLAGNVDCVRLRVSMEGILNSFDPRRAASPVGIFNTTNEESDFECVPLTLMEQVTTFLNDVREGLRHSMAKDLMTIKNESLAVESDHKMEKALDHNRDSLRMLGDSLLDFQKKFTLHELRNQPLDTDTTDFPGHEDFPSLLSELEKEDHLFSSVLQSRNAAAGRLRESRQQFILVASLLDRIPNLAGLARTCEVFKAAGLTIADASILHDKQFQLISVTADKWVPIIEVPVCSMKAFLEKKRCEGFSILGLEQTANSTPLDQYSFSKKTVLVLGREKEGIPVDIIHCLDACLEIPQLGVIRSLNVHVSGAIALWEYSRQQRLRHL